jgi:hypothetical protein
MRDSSLDRERETNRAGPLRCRTWDGASLTPHGANPGAGQPCFDNRVCGALTAEVRKAISRKLRSLAAADWPIVAAIAATLLIVATLPQNSTVLADQIVAGHLRSLAMFASAWVHARAEIQRGVSRVVLLQFHRLLDVAS